MLTLNIVGAGKLGRTLGRLWQRHQVFELQDVLTTQIANSSAAAEFIGAGSPRDSLAAMREARVWMLTPLDDRIADVAAALAASGLLCAGDVVFHCSGAHQSAELAPATGAGAKVASVHPIKSVADPARAVETFAGTWCAAEGDPQALAVLEPAFQAIGARLFAVDPASKTIYHAASVIVCNLLTALIEAGARCYEHAGVDKRIALAAMEPLVRETVDSVFRLGTGPALTGPIARGDHAVVARHLEALAAWEPRIAALYQGLGAVAADLAREQGKVDAEALAAIERTLSADK